MTPAVCAGGQGQVGLGREATCGHGGGTHAHAHGGRWACCLRRGHRQVGLCGRGGGRHTHTRTHTHIHTRAHAHTLRTHTARWRARQQEKTPVVLPAHTRTHAKKKKERKKEEEMMRQPSSPLRRRRHSHARRSGWLQGKINRIGCSGQARPPPPPPRP